MIATLATRADEAGIRTCVVSTDRDAFQLVSENVCLMMTPRGVADVHVYTPERVELRYGVRPDQVPDFIGLKGDTSDNIPGVPGIGDKTAGQLIAQYGSVESVRLTEDEVRQTFGSTLSALPGRPTSYMVYFLEGKDELTEESRTELDKVFAELKRRPLPDIVVIGPWAWSMSAKVVRCRYPIDSTAAAWRVRCNGKPASRRGCAA